jgi:hypothetical protein
MRKFISLIIVTVFLITCSGCWWHERRGDDYHGDQHGGDQYEGDQHGGDQRGGSGHDRY